MKLRTAQEVREAPRADEEPLAKVIAAINTAVAARHAAGHLDALIGFSTETQCFAELPERDRHALKMTMELAGYKVTNGPGPKTIRVGWGEYQDPQD